MITAKQVAWIFDRSRDFMKQLVKNPPSSEEEWKQVMGQVHDLMRRGREHPLLVAIMVDMLGYVDGDKICQEGIQKNAEKNGAGKM